MTTVNGKRPSHNREGRFSFAPPGEPNAVWALGENISFLACYAGIDFCHAMTQPATGLLGSTDRAHLISKAICDTSMKAAKMTDGAANPHGICPAEDDPTRSGICYDGIQAQYILPWQF